MVDVALRAEEGPVTREEIAGRQGISAAYLAQLFARLVRADLVESIRGPGGGYVLARSPRDIRAGDIVRAVEESLEPVPCVNACPDASCPRVDECVTRLLWKRLGERIEEVLDAVTLEELRVEALELGQGASASEQCAA
jgi:Rrf2 family protein